MNTGTKRFGYNKETKKIEGNPANLRRGRDFVARYANPDELSFLDSHKQEELLRTAAQSASSSAERQGDSHTQETRGQGSMLSVKKNRRVALVPQTNRHSPASPSELPSEEFPVIEFPSTNDEETEGNAAIEPAAANNPMPFLSFSATPIVEEPEHGAGSRLMPAIELDQEKREASAEDSVQKEWDTETAFIVTPQETTVDMVVEGRQPAPTRDSQSTFLRWASQRDTLQEEPVVARKQGQNELSRRTSSHKTAPVLRRTQRQRRMKRTHVSLGQRQAAEMEFHEETTMLLPSSETTIPEPAFVESSLIVLDENQQGLFAEDGPELKEDGAASLQTPVTTRAREAQGEAVQQSGGKNPPAGREELEKLDPCLVSFVAPDSFAADQYRVLRQLVERLRGERRHSCIVAVSSPSTGDGKTTTALNLAGVLAQVASARVLLIDADLRCPRVLERLGQSQRANRGLAEAVLSPRVRLHHMVVQYAALNLTVLSSGRLPSSSPEIFKTPRFGALLEEARLEYDYIILDTPPLIPLPDCRLIAQWVDGFLIVVAARKTPRTLVHDALSVLTAEKILGLVFNGEDSPVGEEDEQIL